MTSEHVTDNGNFNVTMKEYTHKCFCAAEYLNNAHKALSDGNKVLLYGKFIGDYDDMLKESDLMRERIVGYVASLESLESLVRDMRDAQKAYFSDRSQQNLVASKTLERDVDKRIAEISSGQQELFK